MMPLQQDWRERERDRNVDIKECDSISIKFSKRKLKFSQIQLSKGTCKEKGSHRIGKLNAYRELLGSYFWCYSSKSRRRKWHFFFQASEIWMRESYRLSLSLAVCPLILSKASKRVCFFQIILSSNEEAPLVSSVVLLSQEEPILLIFVRQKSLFTLHLLSFHTYICIAVHVLP